MRKRNIVEQNQEKLRELKSKSNRALDVVRSTIDQLEAVNKDIDVTINEINEAKEKLQLTETELDDTRLHNTKIIDKFRALIE